MRTTKAPPVRRLRRLFWDIETSPNVVLSFRIGYNLNLGHHSIVRERAIICICWKWEGEKKIHSLQWDKHQNDRDMVIAFMKVARRS